MGLTFEHVRCLRELSANAGLSDIELYERAAPFPLNASRAKGRRFDAAARRSAGRSGMSGNARTRIGHSARVLVGGLRKPYRFGICKS